MRAVKIRVTCYNSRTINLLSTFKSDRDTSYNSRTIILLPTFKSDRNTLYLINMWQPPRLVCLKPPTSISQATCMNRYDTSRFVTRN